MEPTSQILFTGLLMAGAYAAFRALGRVARRRRDEVADFARRATQAAAERQEPKDLGTLHRDERGVYVPAEPGQDRRDS